METASKAFFFCAAIASSMFAVWVILAGYYPWKHGPVYRSQEPAAFWLRVIILFGVTVFLLYALFLYHPAVDSP